VDTPKDAAPSTAVDQGTLATEARNAEYQGKHEGINPGHPLAKLAAALQTRSPTDRARLAKMLLGG